MRAAVQGQLDIGVPREVLDVLEVRTSRKQDREEAMPQIVQAHLR